MNTKIKTINKTTTQTTTFTITIITTSTTSFNIYCPNYILSETRVKQVGKPEHYAVDYILRWK